ncbi:MAG: DUF4065 domain-containing protein [Proteobacteria bacterium]|nr:DUF4065 domain-containing protein [Pseudomonadota bacterium]
MANVFDVAKYILLTQGVAITTWKLQKLVYYSQAWSLVWDDAPLFNEEIQAWANGPVCPDLYNAHRGEFSISHEGIDGDPDKLEKNQIDTINKVIEHYSKLSAHQLSELTHSEAPWINAREGLEPNERGNQVIALDAMAEFYGGL